MKIETIIEDLNLHGVKPSHPRIQIYRFLDENRIHPTVDEIFNRLLPENPTLSRTTVYNTLKIFIDKGVVDPVLIEDNEMRFDINRTFHGHFKCDSCGGLRDLFFDSEPHPVKVPEGFVVKHRHFYFRGICQSCSQSDNNPILPQTNKESL